MAFCRTSIRHRPCPDSTSSWSFSSCLRSGAPGPVSRHEEPAQDPPRRARLEPGRSRRSARGFAPERQRDRNGTLRPQPAARFPHSQIVRPADRGGLHRRIRTHPMIRTLLAPLFLLAAILASPAIAQPRAFSVTVEGKGPDVILIPGLMSGRHVWDRTVADLGGKYRVHRLQLAGFAGEPRAD